MLVRILILRQICGLVVIRVDSYSWPGPRILVVAFVCSVVDWCDFCEGTVVYNNLLCEFGYS